MTKLYTIQLTKEDQQWVAYCPELDCKGFSTHLLCALRNLYDSISNEIDWETLEPRVHNITLCAIPYKVERSAANPNSFEFKENSGFAYGHTIFSLVWMGTNWYLEGYDSSSGKVFMPHLCAAKKWLEENYEPQFVNGTAKILKYIGK